MPIFFYKKKYALAFPTALLLLVWSCKKNNEELIVQKVSEAVAAAKSKKAVECRENVLAEAEKIVDSLLLLEAKSSLGDSLANLKPSKPPKPVPIPPVDTAEVRQIFEK